MGGSTFIQAWMVLTEYCEQFQRWGGSNPLDVLAEPLRILLQTGFSFKIWIRLVISTITADLTTQFIFFFLEFQVELLETYKYNVYTMQKLSIPKHGTNHIWAFPEHGLYPLKPC